MSSNVTFTCPECQKIVSGNVSGFILKDMKCPHCGFDYKKALSEIDVVIYEKLQKGKYLEAIKLYKDLTGSSLKVSKEAVEEIARKNNIPVPKSKCFIATACYGGSNEAEVWVLRAWRDQVLLKTFFGKLFVWVYYRISPVIAMIISNCILLKKIIRFFILDVLVQKVLSKK